MRKKIICLFNIAIFLCSTMGGFGHIDAAVVRRNPAVPAKAAASCSFTVWSAGIDYPLGAVVQYSATGNFYKLVNVGTNGSDGTDPTISTWYWTPTQCVNTQPPPGDCNFSVWAPGVDYQLGAIVQYSANGNFYKLVNVGTNGSDGTDPTISTWYWAQTQCSGSPSSPGGFVVSEGQFDQMFPNRNSFYTYAGLVTALSAYPSFATETNQTIAKQEAAAFLANVSHETSGLVYIREVNQANWNSYCQPAGTCGSLQYYGRGPLQLSWNYNYAAAGSALGLDLLNNPDLVATNAAVSWETAIWYWMTGSGAASQTSHQAMATGAGFGETIRAINGGIECNATGVGHQEMLDRVSIYTNFTSVLGVPVGNNTTC